MELHHGKRRLSETDTRLYQFLRYFFLCRVISTGRYNHCHLPPIFHSLVGTYPFFLEKKTLDHGSPRSMARIHQNSRCYERKSYNPLSGMGGKKMLPLCRKNRCCNGLIQKEVKRKRNTSPKDRSYKKRGKQGIIHSHA